MKNFTCSMCGQILFFENVQCTRCGRTLAYIPEHAAISPMQPENAAAERATEGTFLALAPCAEGKRYRLCRNYAEHDACNWAVPAEEDDRLCRACRLNDVIPNLSDAHAKDAWRRVERAK